VSLALEGGAGIGRITTGFLTSLAETIDVIEPVARFTSGLRERAPCVRKVYNCGLEEWTPPSDGEGYDLVWTQWCVGHLTDAQLVGYLKRCGEAIRRRGPEGLVVIKENLSTSGEDVFDEEDSSVTRYVFVFFCLFSFLSLFNFLPCLFPSLHLHYFLFLAEQAISYRTWDSYAESGATKRMDRNIRQSHLTLTILTEIEPMPNFLTYLNRPAFRLCAWRCKKAYLKPRL